MDDLTPTESRMLEFERSSWRVQGLKTQAIRDEFDMSATRYYQALSVLIDKPAALAVDPLLVRRLLRLRDARRRHRPARSQGWT